MESKVAQTTLQDKLEVRVGEEVYEVAPPTLATLIRVSELSAKLPNPTGNILEFAVHSAKESRVIGTILAVLILGEQKEKNKEYKKKFNKIANDALYVAESSLGLIIAGILKREHIEGFCLLITSLKGQNLLQPTMIQSGQ